MGLAASLFGHSVAEGAIIASWRWTNWRLLGHEGLVLTASGSRGRT